MSFHLVRPKVCPEPCRSIILGQGTITSGTPRLFRHFAAAAPRGAPVYLHSNGGSIMASMELGRALRQSGKVVQIPQGARCESACVFAFLGGAARTVADGGRLGVHKFARRDGVRLTAGQEVWLANALRTYAGSMGADPSIIALSLGVPSSEMRYLARPELGRYRVVTAGGEVRSAGSARLPRVPRTLRARRSSDPT